MHCIGFFRYLGYSWRHHRSQLFSNIAFTHDVDFLKGRSATSNDSPLFCGEFLAPSICPNLVCRTKKALIVILHQGLNTGQHIYLDASAFLSDSQVFHHLSSKPAEPAVNMNSLNSSSSKAINLTPHYKSRILAAHCKSQKSLQFQPSLTLSLGDVSTQRNWRALVINHDDIDIFRCDGGNNDDHHQVSQLECGATSLPPLGCLQYHTGSTGTVSEN